MAKRRNRSTWNPNNKFVKLDRWLLESEAYRDLSSGERDLLVELMLRYNPQNNGHIPLTARQAAQRTNCAFNTARKRIAGLEAHGFIKCTKKASFSVKDKEPSFYELTMFSVNGEQPTKDFMRWQKQNTDSKIASDRRKNCVRKPKPKQATDSKNASVLPFPGKSRTQ